MSSAIDAAAATAQRDFRVPHAVAHRLAIDLLLVAASVRTSCCLDYVPSASSARHVIAMVTAMARSMNIQVWCLQLPVCILYHVLFGNISFNILNMSL
jgi:hypothetical protein